MNEQKAVKAEDRHREIVYLLKEISSLLKGQAESIAQMADDVSMMKSVLYPQQNVTIIDTSDEDSEHFDPETVLGFTESQILEEMERIRDWSQFQGLDDYELRKKAIEFLSDDVPF